MVTCNRVGAERPGNPSLSWLPGGEVPVSGEGGARRVCATGEGQGSPSVVSSASATQRFRYLSHQGNPHSLWPISGFFPLVRFARFAVPPPLLELDAPFRHPIITMCDEILRQQEVMKSHEPTAPHHPTRVRRTAPTVAESGHAVGECAEEAELTSLLAGYDILMNAAFDDTVQHAAAGCQAGCSPGGGTYRCEALTPPGKPSSPSPSWMKQPP